MSAAPILELAERSAPEDLTSRLRAMLEWSAAAVAERLHHEAASDAERIDRIALIERLQASLEAAKAVEIVAFARSQAARQVELGTDPRLAERGIAGQIALAARLSPSEGSRRLRSARDLVMTCHKRWICWPPARSGRGRPG